jgi:hypothetical protein
MLELMDPSHEGALNVDALGELTTQPFKFILEFL